MKKILKHIISLLFSYKLAIPLSYKILNENDFILNFHSIYSSYKSYQNNEISYYNFNKFISELSKFYNFISLSELGSEKKDNKKKSIILSFDDGFYDFINVLDITYKYNFKPNLNIIIKSSYSKYIPLNILSQSILNQLPTKDRYNFDFPKINLKKLGSTNMSQKVSNIYKYLKTSAQLEINEYIMSQSKMYGIKLPKFLNISNLNKIKNDIEIGIHSYYHSSMGVEDDDFFKKDLINSINFINEKLNLKTNIYAFPNGSYNQSQINILKDKGFKYILMLNEKSKQFSVYSRRGAHGNSINWVAINSFYR